MGEKGFVGGTADTATGLTDLGEAQRAAGMGAVSMHDGSFLPGAICAGRLAENAGRGKAQARSHSDEWAAGAKLFTQTFPKNALATYST